MARGRRTASGELKAQALANAAKFTAARSQTTAFRKAFIGTDKLLRLGHYSSTTYFRNWLLQAGTASHYMHNREGRRILKLFREVPNRCMPAVRSRLRNGQGEAWLKAWSVEGLVG